MNLIKDRSSAELVLFGVGFFAFLLSIAAIIVTSMALDLVAAGLFLVVVIIFALLAD